MRSNVVATGVRGLDRLLDGGFLKGHLYLLRGPSGAGKTTLSMQFLMEGARLGEKTLYIGTSEKADEIREFAASHGWDLSSVHLHHQQVGGIEPLEVGQTILHSSEVDLPRTMESILSVVSSVEPDRLVLDSLTEIRVLAQERHRYRLQLMALKEYFTNRKCTVLLTDNLAEDQSVIMSVVSGLIDLETSHTDYGPDRRSLRIVKMRGQSFLGGCHDYKIARGGLELFPRLNAMEYRGKTTVETISSGLPGLDRMLGGGLDRGTTLLLLGPAGSGKSVLAIALAAAAAERGEASALYIFDERLQTLFFRTEQLGIKLSQHVDAGLITIRQIDPTELTPGEFSSEVQSLVETKNISFLAIDSVNGYSYAMPNERYLPVHLHELSSYLNQRSVTSVFVMSRRREAGGSRHEFDLSYISDTVLVLEPYESDGEVRKSIGVLKRRTGDHERSVREFVISRSGTHIGSKLRTFVPSSGFSTNLAQTQRSAPGRRKTGSNDPAT